MLVDIKGYEGRYQISDDGRIWSCRKKGYMRPTQRSGYPWIILSKDGVQKGYSIHRLVAEAFIPNPDNFPLVGHMDDDKQNNSVSNLYWTTSSENRTHNGLSQELAKAQSKQTYQYDLKGNLIAVYPSVREASRQLNISSGLICDVIHGKYRQTHGFIFSYTPLDKSGLNA